MPEPISEEAVREGRAAFECAWASGADPEAVVREVLKAALPHLEAAAPVLAERAHANSHVASKSAVEVIALHGCSRPENGRPCHICVGQAEKHVRAVERAGMVVVSAADYRYVLDRAEQFAMHRFDADDSILVARLRAALPERAEDA